MRSNKLVFLLIAFATLVIITSNGISSTNIGVVAKISDTKTYVNSHTNFSGKLAQKYVDFSFSYPATWHLDPDAGKGDSSSFVAVERAIAGQGDGPFTLEKFTVGWLTGTGIAAADRVILPQLVSQISAQFSQGFPEYQQVSEGETSVGPYNGYEFRFTSVVRNTGRGDITVWGRAVMVPNPNQKNGALLLMLTSSLAPEIKSVQDVGVKGELPVILHSFRFGAPSDTSDACLSPGDGWK